MNFGDAIKKLNIEDYGERIFNSNSHGELFHLSDYVAIAEVCGEDTGWFREWFVAAVKDVEAHWKRPESVFQHMPRMLQETYRMSTPQLTALAAQIFKIEKGK